MRQWYLIQDISRALVEAYIHCQLDYCNAVLAGTADTVIKWLQSIQNTVACLVSDSGTTLLDHITLISSLHWLPVLQRIVSKITSPLLPIWTLCTTWKCQNVVLICGHHLNIHVLRVQTAIGQQNFACYGPAVWNNLTSALRNSSPAVTEHVRTTAKLKLIFSGQ